ncbi:RNA-binding S4 domain-containing protein [Arsukibacterium sp.]|uniref:RNA-binding S4 domain-containing protein n=1 Tax=Arsukibacterium sp. TaxID=1977258 RepID=UPI00299EEAC1|nr:RNA-binding S4 domain-containing protein [Arsukibacterium sp.]MDX1539510.1 RNA-binding S4 domain-containing protein [Arsukibacterium sp.]
MSNKRDVILNKQPVELYKILKFEGLCNSGGAAKAAVDAGLVKVNGVVETQKRKQVNAGDILSFGSETLVLVSGA